MYLASIKARLIVLHSDIISVQPGKMSVIYLLCESYL